MPLARRVERTQKDLCPESPVGKCHLGESLAQSELQLPGHVRHTCWSCSSYECHWYWHPVVTKAPLPEEGHSALDSGLWLAGVGCVTRS